MAKSKHNRHRDSRRPPTEGAAAEFVTVGWMLSVVTTLVCELLLIATQLYIALAGGPRNEFVAALAAILSLAALVVGTASLLLAAAVVRLRRTQPPRGVLVFSLVVGAMPMAAVLLSMALGRR